VRSARRHQRTCRYDGCHAKRRQAVVEERNAPQQAQRQGRPPPAAPRRRELKLAELGLQLVSSLVVAALTARPSSSATNRWHLALRWPVNTPAWSAPCLPVRRVAPSELRQPPRLQSIRLWIGYAAALAYHRVAVTGSHALAGNSSPSDADVAWRWSPTPHAMARPVGLLGMVFRLPGRGAAALRVRSPFVSVSLGCAMRLLIFVPSPASGRRGCLRTRRAQLVRVGHDPAGRSRPLWMHCDIQRRLRTIDGQAADPRVLIQIRPGQAGRLAPAGSRPIPLRRPARQRGRRLRGRRGAPPRRAPSDGDLPRPDVDAHDRCK